MSQIEQVRDTYRVNSTHDCVMVNFHGQLDWMQNHYGNKPMVYLRRSFQKDLSKTTGKKKGKPVMNGSSTFSFGAGLSVTWRK